MEINREFLQQFCGEDMFRHYLTVPFVQDGFTWATNGHILVRVAEIDGLLPCAATKPINVSKSLAGLETAKFSAARWQFPPHDPSFKGPCTVCDGRGHLHECPNCDCDCEACNGTGAADPERRMSTCILGRIYALNYARMIADLPGLEVSDNEGDWRPLLFRFEGGVGGVMPLKSRHDSHVEIEDK